MCCACGNVAISLIKDGPQQWREGCDGRLVQAPSDWLASLGSAGRRDLFPRRTQLRCAARRTGIVLTLSKRAGDAFLSLPADAVVLRC